MKLFRSTVILFATLLATVPAMAQKPCCKTGAQHFADSVSRGKALYGSGFGVLAVRVGGDTIACINPHKRLLPASNNKLISTGLALVELGPEFRFPTSIAYSGSIKDGVLEGDLYIVGGGDPTIASGDSISLEANQLFSVWKKFIDDAGIREIHGRVIGDGRYFDGMYIPGSWQYTDLGTYYGTGGNGLSFYRNVKSFNVTAGKNVGDPVTVVDSYPDTPWMTYTNESTTGESGTGDELYLYTSELAPVGIMRGTFAVDRRPKTEECSNMFPALTCAWYFTNFLKGNGLRVSGEAADIGQDGKVRTTPTICTGLYPAAEEMTVIGTSYSPTIEQIARITNWRSDNYYAETLYRMIGRKNAGSADYEACQMAEYQALERLGLCTEEINIEDGSGLSRHDYLTPSFFCDFLKAMMGTDVFPAYRRTIGSPGHGMYEYRLKDQSEELRKSILYKSGSMGGVRCYSGYVMPKSGRTEDTIVFSVLVNNCLASTRELQAILDGVVASIAKESNVNQ